MSNLMTLQDAIETVETQFVSVQADTGLSFQREAGFAMQALSGNDFLAKVAMGNRQSLVNAITNVAAIGISLNPAEKQAYLVPRDGRVCLDISYMGLIDLATKSGSIMWAKAELVYSSDRFELNGVDQQPTHIRDPHSKRSSHSNRHNNRHNNERSSRATKLQAKGGMGIWMTIFRFLLISQETAMPFN